MLCIIIILNQNTYKMIRETSMREQRMKEQKVSIKFAQRSMLSI